MEVDITNITVTVSFNFRVSSFCVVLGKFINKHFTILLKHYVFLKLYGIHIHFFVAIYIE
jgi:hypothetical protein